MIPTVYHNLAGTLPEQLAHLRQDLARQPAAPGRAGLTPAEVARIRALKPGAKGCDRYMESARALAVALGVSRSTVYEVRARRSYKNLP